MTLLVCFSFKEWFYGPFWMNFWKTSKRPLTPPASFRKTMLRFFATNFSDWSDPPPFSRKFIVFPLKITSRTATIFFGGWGVGGRVLGGTESVCSYVTPFLLISSLNFWKDFWKDILLLFPPSEFPLLSPMTLDCWQRQTSACSFFIILTDTSQNCLDGEIQNSVASEAGIDRQIEFCFLSETQNNAMLNRFSQNKKVDLRLKRRKMIYLKY